MSASLPSALAPPQAAAAITTSKRMFRFLRIIVSINNFKGSDKLQQDSGSDATAANAPATIRFSALGQVDS
jgi:hypothetical protein